MKPGKLKNKSTKAWHLARSTAHPVLASASLRLQFAPAEFIVRRGNPRAALQISAMLNDERLLEFMTRFFGYGNWAAPVWFIGMEEGGGGSETEISSRLAKWAERGKRDLEDLVSYSQSVGISE